MKLRFQRDGRTFDLKDLERLGSGGEAHVYALAGIRLAAKIYHRHVMGRDDKLRVMLANPPKNPTAAQGHVSIAWPQDLLIDQQGRTVGYVMPLVDQMRRMIDFYNPKTRLKECPLFTYKYLATTASNLAIAVRALHQRGYVMGDVNESNVLVAETTMVTLVDTDSFQVREPGNGKIHHCTVGSPLFTPREMQGLDYSIVERREEQDLFGLGVLLFQLLMEGNHPFQARYTGAGDPPEPVEMIRHCLFPHGTGSAMWQPPTHAPPFGMLDPQLRSLFTRCFVNGHRDPRARPTADEWCSKLTVSLGILIQCKDNPSHLHWPHVKSCPWCERTVNLRGRDPFPHPDQLASRLDLSPERSQKKIQVNDATPRVIRPAPRFPVTTSQPVTTKATVATKPAGPAPTPVPIPWWKRIFGAQPAAIVRSPARPIAAGRAAGAAPKVNPPIVGKLAGTNANRLAQAKAGDLLSAEVGFGIFIDLCGIPHRIPFWLGRTQVTQRQWEALMGNNPSHFRGADLPVERVDWYNAEDFCCRLNAKGLLPTGWRFTLPTVDQWQYACRAGTTGAYAGNLSEMAWYSHNSGLKSHAVATLLANPWGLHDMHGNVWEWCAWSSSDGSPLHYSLGGSWNSGSGNCKWDESYRFPPASRHNFLGFRVAVAPGATS